LLVLLKGIIHKIGTAKKQRAISTAHTKNYPKLYLHNG